MRITKLLLATAAFTITGMAQAQPNYSPGQLDQLVDRVALYPDSLLVQVLAAATYPDQIPEAARWADQHHYLTGQALMDAIRDDQLPWDASVQALLPFPSVLSVMNEDLRWTTDLGNAFLSEKTEVMDSVQRERARARDFGYLRTNAEIIVSGGPYITILPVDPLFVPVPYYDPGIVFLPPRPGFALVGAIRFGFGVSVGGVFAPLGWGSSRFDWGSRVVYLHNSPWGRTWLNRGTYMHRYILPRPIGPRPPERHELRELRPQEREESRFGREGTEVRREHRR